ncbi:AraC family transcriptional regulator [Lachnoclostridium phocaeense]|uniref:AraC family transcriptional regulator n=1 Tax=Lachnoclostridium phocaeense TaxID=1871021 RepID=UPI00248F17A1|nr:AraC family transcriptional regulator [Lachnoclostridium phocaeense]
MSNVLYSIFPSENFIDLGLYQYGWEQCDPAHSFGPAARNHYLFHYVISGTGTLTAENSRRESVTYNVKSGQGFMLFPHQICTYIADSELPWEYTWLEFDGLKVKEFIETAGLTMNTPIYRPRHKDIAQQMKNEMLYIASHSQESPLHLIGHLYLFLDYLAKSNSSPIQTQGNRMRDFYIKEALSFIEQNFQNDISVEDIAAFCNLNRSYFGKIFRDTVGKSPQEFLISYRMSKAGELLKMTSLSIADIGNAVGYPNQLHFSRAFKNVYGVSPRAWRYEQQEKME